MATLNPSSNPFTVDAQAISPDGDRCVLSLSPLDVAFVMSLVQNNAAGGIAIFVGTTRDNFEGKKVIRLEYQAYSILAIKTMQNILIEARRLSKSPLTKLACFHRLGEVPVGETSIVVAVSSPHRAGAFEACSWVVDEVKKRVQIFKQEHYAESEAMEPVWKQN